LRGERHEACRASLSRRRSSLPRRQRGADGMRAARYDVAMPLCRVNHSEHAAMPDAAAATQPVSPLHRRSSRLVAANVLRPRPRQ